jgi:hypothetical protein
MRESNTKRDDDASNLRRLRRSIGASARSDGVSKLHAKRSVVPRRPDLERRDRVVADKGGEENRFLTLGWSCARSRATIVERRSRSRGG